MGIELDTNVAEARENFIDCVLISLVMVGKKPEIWLRFCFAFREEKGGGFATSSKCVNDLSRMSWLVRFNSNVQLGGNYQLLA